jgi:putative transposase
MPHSHICCLIHIVFATAERRPTIRAEMQERLHAYLGGIARENGIKTLAVGGTTDHVHLLLSLPRTVSVAKAVQLLKSGSSKWIHENIPGSKNFAWQEGYGAFSIGVSQRATTEKYIQSQAEHHKRISFAEELGNFLPFTGSLNGFRRSKRHYRCSLPPAPALPTSPPRPARPLSWRHSPYRS